MKKITKKILCILLSLGTFISGASFSHSPIRPDHFGISSSKESIVGEAIVQKLYGLGAIVDDDLTNYYLQNLGNKLAYSNSKKTNTRYNFFAVNNTQINAFAFFGANVGINLGIINAADSEHELAAVMAHEIAHIQQNHLARQMERSKQLIPIAILETIAAIAIGVPDLAIASVAGMQQSMINYTREFEKEADRIGIRNLEQAGFNPQGLPNMFYKMQRQARYDSKPPEYLITHPLYENRIADSRARADSYSYKQFLSSEDFYFIKVRSNLMTTDNLVKTLEKYKANNKLDSIYSTYAIALSYLELNKPKQALETIQTLGTDYADNIYIGLLKYDICKSLGEDKKSFKIIEQLYKMSPNNPAVLYSLAESFLSSKQPDRAYKILQEYDKKYKNPSVYELMAKTQSMLGNKALTHVYKAKWHVMRGEHQKAFKQLEIAKEFSKNNINTERTIENYKIKLEKMLEDQEKA